MYLYNQALAEGTVTSLDSPKQAGLAGPLLSHAGQVGHTQRATQTDSPWTVLPRSPCRPRWEPKTGLFCFSPSLTQSGSPGTCPTTAAEGGVEGPGTPRVDRVPVSSCRDDPKAAHAGRRRRRTAQPQASWAPYSGSLASGHHAKLSAAPAPLCIFHVRQMVL